MVHDRKLSIRSFDISLGRVPFYTQYLIIILSLALLHLQLRGTDVSLNSRLARIRLMYRLVFSQRGLPVSLFAKGFRFSLAGFGVGRIEVQSVLAVGNGRLGLS